MWNADTKAVKHLTPHKGDAQYSPSSFDRESKYLYYTTNDGSEFTRLRRYELATGTHEDVEKANWDVLGVGVLAEPASIASSPPTRMAVRRSSVTEAATGKVLDLAVAAVGRCCQRDVREERIAAGVLPQRGSLTERPLFLEAWRREAGEADHRAESGDRSERSRRHAGRPLQGARRRRRSRTSSGSRIRRPPRARRRRSCGCMAVLAGRRPRATAP